MVGNPTLVTNTPVQQLKLPLDPKDPMAIARIIVMNNFTKDGLHTLWRYRGTFWKWTGSYYQMIEDETLQAHIYEFLDKAERCTDGGRSIPFKPMIDNVKEVKSAMIAICQLDEHLEAPAWLSSTKQPPAVEFFACANGLLHLPSGNVWLPTPDYFCLNASTVVYDAKAPTPTKFHTFLGQLFSKDQEAINSLQDWFGYTLSPDTSQQKLLCIIGPRRSGKGTLMRILYRLLGGARSVAGPTMNSLGDSFGLEPLIGKSLAIISDLRIGRRTDKAVIVERILSITGEDALTVGRKYRKAWTGKLPTRLVIITNELFGLPEGSGAFVARFILLKLVNSFLGKEDPKLTDKLTTELSGILNWAIAGYRRINKRGYFTQPKSGKEAVENIETLSAPIKLFIRDECEIGPTKTVTVDKLYSRWKTWCSNNAGIKDPGSKDWFGRNLHAAVPGLTRTKPGKRGDQTPTYQGIGLLTVM